ncbi:LysR family transcriptional regulator [Amycolatopsis alkalitolerans]|uniref:LysR family transcriptional regulator n=1 Tax=Amycolatopsis alkalitolerans TaxID=2547244 RepID=A0A5C4M163_9PSEU|nr:LysR family transcriptional regulator [Amycolatopsis alkalitolerans]TNC26441.1 LysR family transcriptional regulator [Amycolatopsis alkalitolerans]
MDVAWLESLLALLEHGSFTRAAEALHISQPAFSRRIRSLEHWAGAELVDRSTFPVSLTPAGVKLRAQAHEVVANLAAVRDEVRGRQLMPREAVRLAISHTLASHYFAGWWAALTVDKPRLTCLLLPSNNLDAYDALLHGGCDLLLAYADPAQPLGIDRSEVESLVVARERLSPYARARDGAAEYALPGSPNRLVPFVSHGAGAFLGRVTDRLLATRRAYLRPVVQSDLTSALAQLVRAGFGVGWLPGVLARDDVGAGTLAQLGGPEWTAELEVQLHRNRRQRANPRAAEVWELAALDAGRRGVTPRDEPPRPDTW